MIEVRPQGLIKLRPYKKVLDHSRKFPVTLSGGFISFLLAKVKVLNRRYGNWNVDRILILSFTNIFEQVPRNLALTS